MNADNMTTMLKELPKHLAIAEQFVIEAIYDFNPEQLNEIAHYIKNRFRECREFEIEDMKNKLIEMHKQISYLQETLEFL